MSARPFVKLADGCYVFATGTRIVKRKSAAERKLAAELEDLDRRECAEYEEQVRKERAERDAEMDFFSQRDMD